MQTARVLWSLLIVVSCAAHVLEPRVAAAQDRSVVGEWTGVMPWPDKAVHSALLHTGKVLWYRGEGTNAQSYEWDPVTNTLQSQPFNPNIFCSGLSTLPDGRVFVSGGRITGSRGPRHSWIYDPVTSTWTQGPVFRQGRYYPTNLQLPDGRTLIFSGYDESAVVNEQVESYTPGATEFELLAGANRFMAYYPRMHVLPNGKVFHVGKEAESQTFDPATHAWASVATSNFGSRSHGTSVLLPGLQKVMILGDDGETETAEIIDLSAPTPRWTYTPPMRYPRGDLSAVILPDATVLVAGGVSGGSEYPVELYDPPTNTWKLLAPMHSERKYHSSAVLLPDGRVLVAGADDNHTAEVFSPPYLFRGPRPQIDSAPTSVQYGQSFQVLTGNAATTATVILIRPGAATHAQDMQQRYVQLAFGAAADGALDVVAPSDPNVAPPGYYMLFILGADKIPSVAKFVLLGGSAAPPPPPEGNRPPTVDAGPGQPVTLPAVASLQGVVSDDGKPEPPALRSVWSMASGPGPVAFADSLSPTTTASFTQHGTYELRLTGSDGELSAADVVTVVVQSACGATAVIESQIAAGSDDAEESASTSVSLTSSDLELVMDGGLQTVGLRFTGIFIPQGTRITSAYVQFKADEAQSGATSLTIRGVDADSATTFTSARGNLSTRPKTDAFVTWQPRQWLVGAAGPDQRTTDLASVIQEIVDRPGWRGRSLALLFTGSGHRTAEAFEGDRLGSARLHIETSCERGNRRPTVSAGPDQVVTLPADGSLAGTVTDDGLPNPVRCSWGQVAGPGDVTFGEDLAASTTVRFPASGAYVLTLTAYDGEYTASDSITITVRQPGATEIFERRVAAGSDDAEEKPSGSVSLTSSDLELVYDGGNQTIGLRFTGINIPRGATISNAYVQFAADEAQTEATTLRIQAQDADNPGTFTTARTNVSSRTKTLAFVEWRPGGWTAGAAGTVQRTPDLAAVVQAVVRRPNWTSGNSLVLLVTGTGHRTAEAFEGTQAPLLHVEFGSTGDTHAHETEPGTLAGTLLQLGPVFPNPGPGPATVHFELAREADVALEVFDLRGALVRRISSGHRSAGHYIESWDGRDRTGRRLPKGVYMMRFSAAGQREARKFVVLN